MSPKVFGEKVDFKSGTEGVGDRTSLVKSIEAWLNFASSLVGSSSIFCRLVGSALLKLKSCCNELGAAGRLPRVAAFGASEGGLVCLSPTFALYWVFAKLRSGCESNWSDI